jgi:3-oxoacyl-[acyl-carrier protein] reductase
MRLALEGSQVAICARTIKDLTATAASIRSRSGRDVLAVQADVAKADDIGRLVESTRDHFGRIDILVANAGGPPAGEFLDLSPADWEAAVQLTLMSVVRLCYSVVPLMKEQGGGAILAMTSVSVKQPLPNLVLSNSLRLGVTGLVKTLSSELGPSGIRANSILPGWTHTERVEALLEDRATRHGTSTAEEADRITSEIPLGRMATPEEFAAAAAFLVSPAAAYITGVNLLVDGGLHRGAL